MATPIIYNIKSINKWDKNAIRPGPVGSVGDALTSERMKQSTPELPLQFDRQFNPYNNIYRGSNVQDGRWYSFSDRGYNAKLIDRNIDNIESVGWIKQNVVPADRNTEPLLMDQPGQGFKNQAAEILQKQGDMFSTLPGGYEESTSGSVLRGKQVPAVIARQTYSRSKYSF